MSFRPDPADHHRGCLGSIVLLGNRLLGVLSEFARPIVAAEVGLARDFYQGHHFSPSLSAGAFRQLGVSAGVA